jgi:hypothetical protein
VQHERQHNDSNARVATIVTAMAAVTMATTVAAAAARPTVATLMVGGTDNNQLKVAAEEKAAAATETANGTEMATRRHSSSCGDMPNHLKRWKAW